MKRLIASVIVIIHFWPIAQAQNSPCGTTPLMQSIDAAAYYEGLDVLIQASMQKNARQQSATLVIPTVFHVVYNTPAQNIPDSMIFQQLQIMNDDFQRKNADTANTPAAFHSVAGNMDIEFCLAQQTPAGAPTTGIVRVPTSETSFDSPITYSVPDPVKHTNSGGSDAWDTDHYLNIWVCNLNGSTAYSAPPGNFMPADEGVVCKYQHVGMTNVYPYGEGRSIVHEIGHYFCLKHIWGDDAGSCSGTDYIGDTPNQANYSTNCPNFPLIDACSPNSPGIMFMNYMDYSEDGCRNMFTQGQTAYMLSCITSLRPGFLTAQGCMPVVAVEESASDHVELALGPDQIILTSKEWIDAVRIYDLRGGLLVSKKGLSSPMVRIDIANLSHGVFLVAVELEGGLLWRKKVVW